MRRLALPRIGGDRDPDRLRDLVGLTRRNVQRDLLGRRLRIAHRDGLDREVAAAQHRRDGGLDPETLGGQVDPLLRPRVTGAGRVGELRRLAVQHIGDSHRAGELRRDAEPLGGGVSPGSVGSDVVPQVDRLAGG